MVWEKNERAFAADDNELSLKALASGSYAFYRFANVAINVWLATPDGKAVDVLAELTTQSRKSCPHGLTSVHWIAEGTGVPTAEARAGLRSIVERDGDHVRAVGVVLHGEGFWASALRSALSGIMFMVPKSAIQTRLFGTPEEMAVWFVPEHIRRTGTPLERALLLAKIQEAVHDARRR